VREGRHALCGGGDSHLVDHKNDPKDVTAVRALQDAIKAQPAGLVRKIRKCLNWDPAMSEEGARCAAGLASTCSASKARSERLGGEVDPVPGCWVPPRGWGGNPDKDAPYLGVTPAQEWTCTHGPQGGGGGMCTWDAFWVLSACTTRRATTKKIPGLLHHQQAYR
jgi:hypothetical protein